MSGRQHPNLLSRACPETSLFPLRGHEVGFLSDSAVSRVLHEPVSGYELTLPPVTVQRVFVQTAGNPYHVAEIAYHGIAHLNTEHRTVLAPQDVDEIAAMLVATPANITSSSFDSRMLTAEEQQVALDFVKALDSQEDSLSVAEALRKFPANVIQELQKKYILENVRSPKGERLRIRGRMLTTFLRNKLPPSPLQNRTRSVGIFVDYENIQSYVETMRAEDVGKALVAYASRYGRVVCQWACADPRNIPNISTILLGLEQANFQVKFPSGETETGPAKNNSADFVLIECINDESINTRPDIYIIVTGDKDYYEKIISLLKNNKVVGLCASLSRMHLATKYKRLEAARELYSDFFIDDLDEALQAKLAS